MTATCIEVVDAWGRQIVGALKAGLGLKGGSFPDPFRIEHPDRPTAEPPERLTADMAEIRQWFAKHTR